MEMNKENTRFIHLHSNRKNIVMNMIMKKNVWLLEQVDMQTSNMTKNSHALLIIS